MLSLSPVKIVIIIAVILIVLGPDKLPEVARQIGGVWRSLKQWQSRIENEVREVVPDLPSTADIARIARSPINLLNSLADKIAEPLDLDTEVETNDQVDTESDPSLDVPEEPDPALTPQPFPYGTAASPLDPRTVNVADPSLN